jgi:hypothetical protein
VANPVEVGAVHRLVFLRADESVVEDEPLALLVAGYYLNLDTIQVLVRDAEVLLLSLVRLLLPPLSLQLVTPTTRAMRQN